MSVTNIRYHASVSDLEENESQWKLQESFKSYKTQYNCTRSSKKESRHFDIMYACWRRLSQNVLMLLT